MSITLRSIYQPYLAILFLALTFFACKPRLDLSQRNPKLQAKEAKLLMSKLQEKHKEYNWITGKIDSKINFNGNYNEFTANFRLHKDSLVWLSISPALGIEVARVQVTPDSVMFLNKLNKTYFVGGTSFLKNSLRFDEMDLCFIQSTLLAEPLLLDDEERWKAEIDSVYYVLKNVPGKKLRKALGINSNEDFDLPPDSMYLYDEIGRKLGKVLRKNKENDRFLKRYFLNENFQLVRVLLNDVINNRLLSIYYSDYQLVDGMEFPGQIIIEITDNKENSKFELNYTKIKTETPSSVSFKIPEKYEPINP